MAKNAGWILLGIGAAIGGIIWWEKAHAAPSGGKRSPCPPIGDPDGDGWVSQLDIDFIEKCILATVTPTAEQFRRADVNGDGVLDMGDVIVIKNFLAGTISIFPACSV